MRSVLRGTLRVVVTIAAGVGWAVTLVFLLNSCNPFARMFLQEYSIRNATDQELLVTPLASLDTAPSDSTDRSLLPLYATRVLLIPAIRRSRFAVGPGETLSLTYDADGLRPTEVVVETPDGRVLQRGDERTSVLISDLSAWEPVQPPIRVLVTRTARRKEWVAWGVFCLLGSAMLWSTVGWRRRRGRSSSVGAA